MPAILTSGKWDIIVVLILICLVISNVEHLCLGLPAVCMSSLGFPVAQMVKNLPTMQDTRVWSLGQEDPLEKGMATHSSILAWRIPWTEEPSGLQSMESQSQTRLSDLDLLCLLWRNVYLDLLPIFCLDWFIYFFIELYELLVYFGN